MHNPQTMMMIDSPLSCRRSTIRVSTARGAALASTLTLALGCALTVTTLPAHAQGANAWNQGHWRAVVSPYAPHIRPSPEHEHVWAVGMERQRQDRWLMGASLFSNSFGQPSAYLYFGRRFQPWSAEPRLFTQLSGGLMYGYTGDYLRKVPFNRGGYSPGALASVGWQFSPHASLTVHAVGDAAVMFQFGWDFR